MNNAIAVIVAFVVTLLLAWVILSLILQYARPNLYNDESVDWMTSFWVTLCMILALWFVLFIGYMLIGNGKEGKPYQSWYSNFM